MQTKTDLLGALGRLPLLDALLQLGAAEGPLLALPGAGGGSFGDLVSG